MYVTVNLLSKKTGEIKDFLESYYQKELKMDNDIEQWIYVYNKPLQAIDLISTVIDNSDKYKMTLLIQVDRGDIHTVTYENCNDIIKALLYLCYKENDTYQSEEM
ncbi:hypothetical protein [Acetivibrio mesophilus]|uniref:Uncharacterized protein n=1 Tax=Acetivibrio mesophilus TaxID=2487273 RepID=A0A4Q0I6Y9_9FIRM|nr:hypothetical protein [Acetivibrio mesophilus]ODM24925.1 hypothetical protein A7W90_01135 [Clostridium sp. Bc-iso-3]RXE60078.1 hypothetical protein EFD62_04800 [Acetivibrio mesophilus]HHV28699.1 hypothetical protein [Clostridium sp.]